MCLGYLIDVLLGLVHGPLKLVPGRLSKVDEGLHGLSSRSRQSELYCGIYF